MGVDRSLLIAPLAAIALWRCTVSRCSPWPCGRCPLSLPVDHAGQRSNWIERSGLGEQLRGITAIAEGEPRQLS
jgi:hypothetical protein